MKELKEIAANYAAGKANEAIDKAIAQAYADGYRDGYKDREEEIPIDLRDNKAEFVDLGLPSGTLWSKEFEKEEGNIKFVPYIQAKRYTLPTREQWEELVSFCEKGWYGQLIRFTGKNGETLDFPRTGRFKTNYEDRNKSFLWLEEEPIDNETALVMMDSPWSRDIEKCFMGFRAPIRQVR